MAVIAGIATRNMVRRLSCRCETVMTGSTGSAYLRVVDGVHRRKRVRVVTVFAHVGRRYVGWVFSGRIRTVMAAPTVTDDIDVIEISRYPARRRMTIVTIVAAVHVRRVLTGGRNSVVTGAAAAHHLRVVNGKHGSKNIGVVAVLTDIGRLDVRRVLAGGFGAVVAIETAARDVYVIEVRRQPADRRVTVITISAACNVRRVLASCRDAVMAGAAGTEHLRVIDRNGWLKCGRAVAVLANIGCLDVHRTFAGCAGAIMATHAISGDSCVIVHGREPGSHVVAIVALIIGRNVIRCLSRRLDTIVATGAAAGNGRVIHESNYRPIRGDVAV